MAMCKNEENSETFILDFFLNFFHELSSQRDILKNQK